MHRPYQTSAARSNGNSSEKVRNKPKNTGRSDKNIDDKI